MLQLCLRVKPVHETDSEGTQLLAVGADETLGSSMEMMVKTNIS